MKKLRLSEKLKLIYIELEECNKQIEKLLKDEDLNNNIIETVDNISCIAQQIQHKIYKEL